MRFPFIAIGLAGAITLGLGASVANAQAKPEDLLKMRQGVWQSVKYQFGPMGAFLKGEGPYVEDTVVRSANLAALAKIVPQLFAPGSENLPNSKAKPEAFVKAEFKVGMDAFAMETAKLADVAKGTDQNAVKAQLAAVAKTCKGCHDNFKAD